MVEDSKAARHRRLAEALRANLKRRKAAAKATEDATQAKTPTDRPKTAEGES